MADKGFLHVKCDLESKDVTLVIAPFAKANQQFTKAEMKETKLHFIAFMWRDAFSASILHESLTPEVSHRQDNACVQRTG